ncbi:hypothetical protein LSAT2_017872, partial [Lamellibrachia satsuma]
ERGGRGEWLSGNAPTTSDDWGSTDRLLSPATDLQPLFAQPRLRMRDSLAVDRHRNAWVFRGVAEFQQCFLLSTGLPSATTWEHRGGRGGTRGKCQAGKPSCGVAASWICN